MDIPDILIRILELFGHINQYGSNIDMGLQQREGSKTEILATQHGDFM